MFPSHTRYCHLDGVIIESSQGHSNVATYMNLENMLKVKEVRYKRLPIVSFHLYEIFRISKPYNKKAN